MNDKEKEDQLFEQMSFYILSVVWQFSQ